MGNQRRKIWLYHCNDSAEIAHRTVEVNNGETVSAPVIKLHKTEQLVRGVLKGYPVDAVTGRPLSKFTVTQATPYNQRKSKTFETAADFRDSGWTNLDGGDHHYTITAPNYKEFTTAGEDGNGKQISIGAAAANMGTIYVEPLTVAISGALKLPGYVLDAESQNIAIWAEAAGKRVASFTTTAAEGDFFNGSLNFTLDKVPVTAGSVAVKCKVRGYDIVNLQSTLAITSANPGGTIAIGETDFINNIAPHNKRLLELFYAAPSRKMENLALLFRKRCQNICKTGRERLLQSHCCQQLLLRGSLYI